MLTCDFHVDLPWIQSKYWAFDLNAGCEHSTCSIRKLKDGKLDSMFCALYLPDTWMDNYPAEKIDQTIGNQIRRLLTQSSATIVDSAADAEDAFIKGLFPMFLGLEGGRLLGPEQFALGRLTTLRNQGVRYLTLTHNRNNDWADSATDLPKHNGLTPFGVKVIRKCEELSIYVDVSHTSDATAAEAIAVSEMPVLATHSGARHFVKHPRNLSDNLIRAIAATDGVIGVPFARKFVGENIADVAKHVDYILELTGSVDNVAIGSDLDGAAIVDGVRDASDWKKVMEALSKRGLSDRCIEKISGENIMRLF